MKSCARPIGGALAAAGPCRLLWEARRRQETSRCHWLLRRYKYEQMAFTGSEQAETPREEQDAADAAVASRSRWIGHISSRFTPTQVNEGATPVSESSSEIRHGSQSECEV